MRYLIFICLLAALFVTACDESDSEKSGYSTAKAEAIEALADSIITQHGVPGMIVYVRDANKAVYRLAAGRQTALGDTLMEPDLICRIGSTTKSFTAAGIIRLAEQGLLALDDNVTLYLDSTYVNDFPCLAGITLRQLLNMTSGLPDYASDSMTFAMMMLVNPTMQIDPHTLVQYGVAIDPDLMYPPGTQYRYSNTNYILLGLVIEQVTGQTWASYVSHEFIEPFGLTGMSYPETAQLPEPHPRGYLNHQLVGFLEVTEVHPSVAWAAGGLVSDAASLAKWFTLLANGDVLSAWGQSQLEDWQPTNTDWEYGMGFSRETGMYMVGHGGSIPGFRTEAWYSVEHDVTIVVFQNLYEDSMPYTMDVVYGVMEILGYGAAKRGNTRLIPGWF